MGALLSLSERSTSIEKAVDESKGRGAYIANISLLIFWLPGSALDLYYLCYLSLDIDHFQTHIGIGTFGRVN